jgi:fructokinase
MKKPTIIGTGLLALDVVIADSIEVDPLLCAGGTCGNVLTSLSFLGWNAFPIARLRSDAASKQIADDLSRWGVRTDFVTFDDDGSTPVVVQRIKQNKAGNPSHSFSRKCPQCGDWLPWYKAVRVSDVSSIEPRLPKADVFYFDRTSRGAVTLAQEANRKGNLVVFEPSAGSEPAMMADALAVSHIVKIASDRLSGNEGILDVDGPLLLIETRGAEGLRFRKRSANGRGRWKKLPAKSCGPLRDTSGAGDWCTAGLLNKLGPLGVSGLKNSDDAAVVKAIEFGQAMAAWACGYHGARGGMYVQSKQKITKTIRAILTGDSVPHSNARARTPATKTSQPIWCDCCLTESVG